MANASEQLENRFIGEILADGVSLPKTVDELRAIVITNMARERERCAKIAEQIGDDIDFSWTHTLLAEKIAEAIRSGK